MLLQTDDLTVTYGGLRAIDHLSLDVAEGELLGLIGPNGAGKTTFIDAVSGFATSTGRVLLDGVPLDELPPHRRVGRGLVRSFQQVELFDDLDVSGNLLVAAESPAWWRPLVDLVRPRRPTVPAAVERAVDLLGIEHLMDRPVAELSEGERKLVGLGRALACSPRLLLLDEPAAGLDSTESLALGERLRTIVAAGITVLLVDHDMGLVLGVCDRIHVIDHGVHLATGAPDEIRHDDAVVAAYLGASAEAAS